MMALLTNSNCHKIVHLRYIQYEMIRYALLGEFTSGKTSTPAHPTERLYHEALAI